MSTCCLTNYKPILSINALLWKLFDAWKGILAPKTLQRGKNIYIYKKIFNRKVNISTDKMKKKEFICWSYRQRVVIKVKSALNKVKHPGDDPHLSWSRFTDSRGLHHLSIISNHTSALAVSGVCGGLRALDVVSGVGRRCWCSAKYF